MNIDLCDMEHIHHKCSIDKLPMFEDATVDVIYTSHSLEYFDLREARSALSEWRRVLKPGGLLRIAVPDFEKLVEVYERTRSLNAIIGPLYGRMEIQTVDGVTTLYHRLVYDFSSLKELLLESGFANVRRYDWRKTVHKDYDDHSQAYFPHLDKDNGLLISLNVEADRV